jgi:hypothetical protein
MLFVGYSAQDTTFISILDSVKRAFPSGYESVIGTILHSFHNPMTEELLIPYIMSVSMCDTPSQPNPDIDEANYRMEIFLDKLVLLSYESSSGYLMDHRFYTLLSAPERMLRTAVKSLKQELDTSRTKSSPAYALLQSALSHV